MDLKYLLAGIAIMVISLQAANAASVSCQGIWVDTEDIEIRSDDVDYFFFRVYNDEDEEFSILEARAWHEEGPFEIEMWDYPGRIDPEDSGTVTVRVEADRVSGNEFGEAYIELRGQFEDGEYCTFGEIGEFHFDVLVEKGPGDGECRDIEIRASNVYIDESDVEIAVFRIINDSDEDFSLSDIDVSESSPYFDATLYRKPSKIRSDDEEEFRVRIEAERVSRDEDGEVRLEARGRFESGDYCGYSDIDEETFRVYVDNSGSTSPGPGNECEDVELNASTIRVEQGETKHATVYLENDTDEDFLIDYVSIFDSSAEFQAEENGYEKEVPAFGDSYVNVKVRAYDNADLGSYEAFVEVRGHFQGENSCYLFNGEIDTIPVVIEEKQEEPFPIPDYTGDCAYFSLIVPDSVQVGNSGTVPITIDNRTMGRATVRLYGPGLTVQPQLISVPKNTMVSERVSVSSALANTNLVYGIEALGCNQTRSTAIVAAGIQEDEEQPEEEEKQAQGEILQGLASGLFVIGQAGAMLGILVLAVLLIYVIFKPKQA